MLCTVFIVICRSRNDAEHVTPVSFTVSSHGTSTVASAVAHMESKHGSTTDTSQFETTVRWLTEATDKSGQQGNTAATHMVRYVRLARGAIGLPSTSGKE